LEENNTNNVRSVSRALQILKCFNWNERGFTLTEIAQKMDLPKSTVSRLLSTIESEGLIKRDERTNFYKLGNMVFFLGLIAKESIDLLQISRPIMEEICQATKETVNLYLLDNMEKVCFKQVESPLAIKRYVRIGERSPIWYGATGRSILANLDEKIWYQMAKKLKKYTEKTIAGPDEFISELRIIKERGYDVSVGEKEHDVGCVAAPIFDDSREVIGCAFISGPQYRFPKDTDYFVSLVVDGARRISNRLGYYEESPRYAE
jgi:IclR family KDG regulon transcriptional repressor